MFETCEIYSITYFHRGIMLKRKQRIRPAEDAKSHILSAADKPWLSERFIDVNKGMGVSKGPVFFSIAFLSTIH